MVQLREVPRPVAGPGQIVLRMRACGICGTDLHIVASQAQDWRPLGHESAGEVVEVGAGVEGISVGQRVVLESSSFCGTCNSCRNGKPALCENKLSPSQLGGGFAEYVLCPAKCAVPFDGLEFTSAALAEPLGVALDMVKTSEIMTSDRVIVFGPGPIGLMAARLCALRGAQEIVVVGHAHSLSRLEVAEQLGASRVLCSDKGEMETLVPKTYSKALVTSSPSVIPDILKYLAFGGIITFIGVDFGPGGDVRIPMNDFHFSRLQLRGSHASPALYFPECIRLIKREVIPVQRLISHTFGLEAFESGLKTAKHDKANAVKVMITQD